MRKSEVYSWRISSDTKTAIETEARRENTTVAALLERITKEWIEGKRGSGGDAEQERLHAKVRRTLGTISGKDPARAQRARLGVRKRIKRRHGR
jgi:hypothetical protein